MAELNFLPNLGLNPDTGYGKIEIAAFNALAEAGFNIRPVGVYSSSGLARLNSAAWNAYQSNKTHKPKKVTLAFGDPDLLDAYPFRDTKNFLFTMSESDRPSDRWVKSMNKFAHVVIVPAPDLIYYYRAAGVNVPVVYLKLGVDPIRSTFTNKKVKGKDDPFVFTGYSLGDSRKNVEATIMAFKRLYDKNPRYKLNLKVRDKGWINQIQDPQISLMLGVVTDQTWYDMLDETDCFVFPSRGEGFGYPPREAVMLGVPTIATPWLGMFDVHSWGFPIVTTQLTGHADHMDNAANHTNAKWADPDIDHLAHLMKYIDNNQAEAIRFTQKGREYLLQNNSWKECTDNLIQILTGVG